MEVGFGKLFPYIFHGLRAWMQHVFFVEAVVAKLIIHDFIGGKVIHLAFVRQLFGCQQQRSLAELTPMEAVFAVPNGADGDDDVHVWVAG